MPFDGTKFETVAAKMRENFHGGHAWMRGAYWERGHNCLVGNFLRTTMGTAKGLDGTQLLNAARRHRAFCYLQRAVNIVNGTTCIAPEDFNDARGRRFSDIARVLDEMERLEIAAQLERLSVKPVSNAVAVKGKKRVLVEAYGLSRESSQSWRSTRLSYAPESPKVPVL